jgi:hypothetical protein
MARFSFPATLAVVALALASTCPGRAGADPAPLGATSDATFAPDVLQAAGPVLVEFGEYG